jgi:hypothetical protein
MEQRIRLRLYACPGYLERGPAEDKTPCRTPSVVLALFSGHVPTDEEWLRFRRDGHCTACGWTGTLSEAKYLGSRTLNWPQPESDSDT